MDITSEILQTDNISSSSPYNLNFKTIFLFVILLCACCLLSIGYNFDINKLFDLESVSFWACLILTLFLFYVLYEFFKSDTCNLGQSQKFADFDKISSSFGRGRSFIGQKGTQGMMSMGNTMNRASQGITSPTLNNTSFKLNSMVQPQLSPQYQNPQFMPNY